MNKLTNEQFPGNAYLNKEGQPEGPYTVDQINERLASGQVQWNDLVWVDGWPEWKQLSSLVALNPPPLPAAEKPTIYLNKDGQQLGPFTLKQVNTQLQDRTIAISDQAWMEGWAQWEPLQSVPGVTKPIDSSPFTAIVHMPPSLPVRTASRWVPAHMRQIAGKTTVKKTNDSEWRGLSPLRIIKSLGCLGLIVFTIALLFISMIPGKDPDTYGNTGYGNLPVAITEINESNLSKEGQILVISITLSDTDGIYPLSETNNATGIGGDKMPYDYLVKQAHVLSKMVFNQVQSDPSVKSVSIRATVVRRYQSYSDQYGRKHFRVEQATPADPIVISESECAEIRKYTNWDAYEAENSGVDLAVKLGEITEDDKRAWDPPLPASQ